MQTNNDNQIQSPESDKQAKMFTRSMIKRQMFSLSSMALSSEDGELDVGDPFATKREPDVKIPERVFPTLNFNDDVPIELIHTAIYKYF